MSLARFVGLFVTFVSPAETAELIEMPFGVVDVGSACVDIRPSPKTDVLVFCIGRTSFLYMCLYGYGLRRQILDGGSQASSAGNLPF